MAAAEVQEALKGYVIAKMDLTDRNPDSPAGRVADRFEVRGIPDVRILGADGAQIGELEGRSASQIAAELRSLMKK